MLHLKTTKTFLQQTLYGLGVVFVGIVSISLAELAN